MCYQFLERGTFTCLNSVFTLLMPPKKKPKSVTPTLEPIKIPEPNNYLSTVLSKEAKDTLEVHGEHGILPSTTTGEKPFACEICDYKCTTRDNLDVHVRTHTGEKQFACEHCDYKCSQKSNLDRHMRAHTVRRRHSSL